MKERILIVEDKELNREILIDILKDEYDVVWVEDGEEALKYLETERDNVSAMLLDLYMPNVDGYAVLEKMNETGWIRTVPVLVITGDSSIQSERRCFEYNVSDFIHKPFDNMLVKRRISNVIYSAREQERLRKQVEVQTRVLRVQNNVLQEQAEALRQSKESVIDILGTVVEYRNLESGQHIARVKGYTRILAKQLQKDYPQYNLTDSKIEVIVAASALHDIGKIAIPDSILLKPGRLTSDEFSVMKTHTSKGSEILGNIKDTWDDEYGEISLTICLYHHERYDGKGYPEGLVGDAIPISAQIVSLADVYDALINERVYKDAFSKEEAFNMIMNGECGVFGPHILDCFEKTRDQFESLDAAS